MNKLRLFHKICGHITKSSIFAENILKPRHISTSRRYQNEDVQMSKKGFDNIRREEVYGDTEEKDHVIANDKRLIPKISWDTSMRYIENKVYKEAYGKDVVWKHYRRNHKGAIAPDTRESCIRLGRIATGSPCPLCRDEYLVVDYRNVKLLNQFVNPFTGELYPTKKTGICQKRFFELQVALDKAVDYGFMRQNLEVRNYDRDEFDQLYRKAVRHLKMELKEHTEKSISEIENMSELRDETITTNPLDMSNKMSDSFDVKSNFTYSDRNESMEFSTEQQNLELQAATRETSSTPSPEESSDSSSSSDSDSSDSDNDTSSSDTVVVENNKTDDVTGNSSIDSKSIEK